VTGNDSHETSATERWLAQVRELASIVERAEREGHSLRVTLYLGADGKVADADWQMGRGGRRRERESRLTEA
jgi:hypothetical protein